MCAVPCPGLLCTSHGLDSVHHQIEKHLLQLHSVALNVRELRTRLRVKDDSPSLRLGADQRDHLAYYLVDFELYFMWDALFNKGADPGDDLAGSVSILDYVRERLAHEL